LLGGWAGRKHGVQGAHLGDCEEQELLHPEEEWQHQAVGGGRIEGGDRECLHRPPPARAFRAPPSSSLSSLSRPPLSSGALVLSKEPLNVSKVNSFKFSGLAQPKAVGLCETKDAKGFACAQLSLKSSKNVAKPSKSVGKALLKKNFTRGEKAIKAQLSGAYYRPDLEAATLARWSRINRAVRIANGSKKGMTVKKGRGSASA
jgi:large subunit ribosomal protein L28e